MPEGLALHSPLAINEPPTIRKRVGPANAVVRLRKDADALCADLLRLRGELDALQTVAAFNQNTQWIEAHEHLMAAIARTESFASTAVTQVIDLAWASERDALTHLPNRALMLDRAGGSIAWARRHGTRIAIVFVDVDNFKKINDEFGHAIGDAALQWVGRRLQSVVRESDSVGRYGGDEFIVLLSELAQSSDAVTVAAKILSTIAEPCRLGEYVFELSVSLGISVYPENGGDAATLIDRADAAMYQAKRRRRGSLAFVAG